MSTYLCCIFIMWNFTYFLAWKKIKNYSPLALFSVCWPNLKLIEVAVYLEVLIRGCQAAAQHKNLTSYG